MLPPSTHAIFSQAGISAYPLDVARASVETWCKAHNSGQDEVELLGKAVDIDRSVPWMYELFFGPVLT